MPGCRRAAAARRAAGAAAGWPSRGCGATPQAQQDSHRRRRRCCGCCRRRRRLRLLCGKCSRGWRRLSVRCSGAGSCSLCATPAPCLPAGHVHSLLLSDMHAPAGCGGAAWLDLQHSSSVGLVMPPLITPPVMPLPPTMLCRYHVDADPTSFPDGSPWHGAPTPVPPLRRQPAVQAHAAAALGARRAKPSAPACYTCVPPRVAAWRPCGGNGRAVPVQCIPSTGCAP